MIFSLDEITPWLADGLVLIGAVVMTIGVYGIYRMPDALTKLHAASKAVVLGVVVLCAATLVTGQTAIIYRVILISILLLLTTPVASHVIGRAAYVDSEVLVAKEDVGEMTGGSQSS